MNIKKTVLLLGILAFTQLSFAQLSEIRGKVNAPTNEQISLFSIEEGRPELLATTKLGESGSFGFLFEPRTEGFYVIGSSDMLNGQYPVYLKRGDKTEIAIDNKRVMFVGKQTPENTVLSNWNDLTQELKVKAVYFMAQPLSTFEDFYPQFTEIAAKTDNFRKGIKTKNLAFNSLMTSVTHFDMDLYAMRFISTPRKAHPAKDQRMAYHAQIVQENKFKNDDVLNYLFGESLLRSYVDYAGGKESVDTKLKYLGTDRQKAVYLQARLSPFIQNYPAFDNFQKKYGHLFTTEVLQARLSAQGQKLYNATAGGEAFVFSFKDRNEKEVSLADFKGKVVLLDVWATWCAPCKKEIPFLKKLEEEFHGKEIVFLSVSVDEAKDKQNWLNMLDSQKLGGVQLYAGSFKNSLTDFYKITTIPRFMVFDAEGKIVSTNSPRPSEPKLKTLLEAELAKIK